VYIAIKGRHSRQRIQPRDQGIITMDNAI